MLSSFTIKNASIPTSYLFRTALRNYRRYKKMVEKIDSIQVEQNWPIRRLVKEIYISAPVTAVVCYARKL